MLNPSGAELTVAGQRCLAMRSTVRLRNTEEPSCGDNPLISNINGSVPLICQRVSVPSMSRTMSWGASKRI